MTDPLSSERIAIIGGGFSGVLLAINLLANADGPQVLLIDRSGVFGPGVAYGTDEPDHLLNVRAAAMDVIADRPQDFLHWLRGPGGMPHADPSDFVQRRLFGQYIRDRLAEAIKGPGGERLSLITDDVDALRPVPGRVTLTLRRGGALAADAAVLALGNLAPTAPFPSGHPVLAHERFIADPWSADPLKMVGTGESVFLIGTSLTMVDVTLTLRRLGHRGQLMALSRRGQLPRHHVIGPETPIEPPPAAATLSRSLQAFRAVIREGADWRSLLDGHRPQAQALWASLPPKQRASFVRHLRPFWEVHRHRLAPAVGARIDALQADETFRYAAGRLVDARGGEGVITADWIPRGSGTTHRTTANWLINCAGPEAGLTRSDEPLLRQLLAEGLIRPSALGLGMDTDAQEHVLARDGQPHNRIMAVGALTRARFWQLTAAPDIRVQLERLASHLLR
ncbi:MAG: FAD/NAD(P)-binding protein [Alphaproteobacteria bacterium]|jgi:hypothetical protein